MTMTTYSVISQRTTVYAAREMLKHAEPVRILAAMGTTKPATKNTAETIKFRRYIPFSASAIPLAEGVTPSAQAMSYEDVSVTLKQYGNFTTITDYVEDVCEDPVLANATEALGEQAGASDELIVYNAIKGGTTVSYANGTLRTDVDGDGREDLVLACRDTGTKRRELRLHQQAHVVHDRDDRAIEGRDHGRRVQTGAGIVGVLVDETDHGASEGLISGAQRADHEHLGRVRLRLLQRDQIGIALECRAHVLQRLLRQVVEDEPQALAAVSHEMFTHLHPIVLLRGR